jgi:hypothetical protein
MERNVKPKGKTYGRNISVSAGVSDGLSEAAKFDPAETQPKMNAKSQRPLAQPIKKAVQ